MWLLLDPEQLSTLILRFNPSCHVFGTLAAVMLEHGAGEIFLPMHGTCFQELFQTLEEGGRDVCLIEVGFEKDLGLLLRLVPVSFVGVKIHCRVGQIFCGFGNPSGPL